MTPRTHPSEKVLAVTGIVKALITELGLSPDPILFAQGGGSELRPAPGGPPTIEWLIPPPVMAALIQSATTIAMATDTRDMGIMTPPPKDGQSIANLCDDCGMPSGAHDYEVEH